MAQQLKSVLPADIVVLPSDKEAYDELRQVKNAAISHHPAAIVRPKSIKHIQDTIKLARENKWSISIKAVSSMGLAWAVFLFFRDDSKPGKYSRGHSNTGFSVVDNSVMLDINGFRDICFNDSSSIQVGAGCTWKDVYSILSPRGLIVSGGNDCSVGVAGLTLGGGYSAFAPMYGLALDQVIEFEMVDSRGELIRASETENSDLFWALRGAGHGSFGCVTKITFQVSKMPSPNFYRCKIEYPISELANLLKQYEEHHAKDPEDETKSATVFVDIRAQTIVLDLVNLGDPNTNLRKDFERFFSIPAANVVYEKFETLIDYAANNTKPDVEVPLKLTGASTKRGGFVKQIDQDAIQCLTKFVTTAQRYLSPITPSSDANAFIYIDYWHGKVGKVHKTATAFYHRRKCFAQIILGSWASRPSEELSLQTWVTDSFHQLSHQADLFGGHPNTPTSGMTDWFRFYWKTNYQRLREIKSKYDPEELFRHPHSVRPLPPPQPETPQGEEEEAPPSRFQSSKL